MDLVFCSLLAWIVPLHALRPEGLGGFVRLSQPVPSLPLHLAPGQVKALFKRKFGEDVDDEDS